MLIIPFMFLFRFFVRTFCSLLAVSVSFFLVVSFTVSISILFSPGVFYFPLSIRCPGIRPPCPVLFFVFLIGFLLQLPCHVGSPFPFPLSVLVRCSCSFSASFLPGPVLFKSADSHSVSFGCALNQAAS